MSGVKSSIREVASHRFALRAASRSTVRSFAVGTGTGTGTYTCIDHQVENTGIDPSRIGLSLRFASLSTIAIAAPAPPRGSMTSIARVMRSMSLSSASTSTSTSASTSTSTWTPPVADAPKVLVLAPDGQQQDQDQQPHQPHQPHQRRPPCCRFVLADRLGSASDGADEDFALARSAWDRSSLLFSLSAWDRSSLRFSGSNRFLATRAPPAAAAAPFSLKARSGLVSMMQLSPRAFVTSPTQTNVSVSVAATATATTTTTTRTFATKSSKKSKQGKSLKSKSSPKPKHQRSRTTDDDDDDYDVDDDEEKLDGDTMRAKGKGVEGIAQQHMQWVQFQQSIAVPGFETGQTVKTTAAASSGSNRGSARGGKASRKRLSKRDQALQDAFAERQRRTRAGGGEFPPFRYDDAETARLLAQAYAAIPPRAGKRGTRNLQRQRRRWFLVRQIRERYKYHMSQFQERKMEARSNKIRDVKAVLADAVHLRQHDRKYQAEMLQAWIRRMGLESSALPFVEDSSSTSMTMTATSHSHIDHASRSGG